MWGKIISLGFDIIRYALKLKKFYPMLATWFLGAKLLIHEDGTAYKKAERFAWVFEQIVNEKAIWEALNLKDDQIQDKVRAALQLVYIIWKWFD